MKWNIVDKQVTTAKCGMPALRITCQKPVPPRLRNARNAAIPEQRIIEVLFPTPEAAEVAELSMRGVITWEIPEEKHER